LDRDISRILESWEYQPDTLIIRNIAGEDGKEKIQIRVNLGILQMETEGRPDGKDLHGAESMLDYYKSLTKELKENGGGNFILTEEDMEELDDELMQYYHRRVCFFALGDYSRARKDAEHNLELMSVIREHCLDTDYIESHERFRPFVIMESARAAGLQSISMGDYATAMKHVGNAINMIEKFYMERGLSQEKIRKSRELIILRKWRSQIHQDWEGGITEMGDGKSDYDNLEL